MRNLSKAVASASVGDLVFEAVPITMCSGERRTGYQLRAVGEYVITEAVPITYVCANESAIPFVYVYDAFNAEHPDEVSADSAESAQAMILDRLKRHLCSSN